MPILGLVTTESDSGTWRFKSVRRKVFYDMPNGAAPLTGITSLLKEEPCSDVEFNWWEKRFVQLETTTNNGGTVFGNAGGVTNNTWGLTPRTNAIVLTNAAPMVSIWVTDGDQIRVGAVIRIKQMNLTAGGPIDVLLRVVQKTPGGSSGNLDCVWAGSGDMPSSLVFNTNNNKEVLVVGNANAQGQIGAGRSPWNTPANPSNLCQIFRTSFDITRTALKTSAKWDPEGVYKDRAAEASRYHMVDIERSFLFGERSVDTTGLSDTGTTSGKPIYYTGGVINFLKAWEAAASDAYYAKFPDYRGSTAAAVPASDNDDNKRIIENAAGTINEANLDKYLERCFRSTQNTANEKLGFCGGVFLNVLNQLYKSKSTLSSDVPLTDTYGMDVVKHRTPFGTIWWKTHPLFNMHTDLRSSALILDTGNLMYRYVDDTDLLENRQAPDEDARRDEWLTECGLEVRYPESAMFIKNVTSYIP